MWMNWYKTTWNVKLGQVQLLNSRQYQKDDWLKGHWLALVLLLIPSLLLLVGSSAGPRIACSTRQWYMTKETDTIHIKLLHHLLEYLPRAGGWIICQESGSRVRFFIRKKWRYPKWSISINHQITNCSIGWCKNEFQIVVGFSLVVEVERHIHDQSRPFFLWYDSDLISIEYVKQLWIF
jgi:hypothetical protein